MLTDLLSEVNVELRADFAVKLVNILAGFVVVLSALMAYSSWGCWRSLPHQAGRRFRREVVKLLRELFVEPLADVAVVPAMELLAEPGGMLAALAFRSVVEPLTELPYKLCKGWQGSLWR